MVILTLHGSNTRKDRDLVAVTPNPLPLKILQQTCTMRASTQISSASPLTSILENFSGTRIAVVGDLMLDHYYWSVVKRISPEAPIPIADVEKESYTAGGATNVAVNLKAMGSTPLLFGVRGEDHTGQLLEDCLESQDLPTEGVVVDPTRPTTCKLRIMASGQQLARADRESVAPIPLEIEERLYTKILEVLPTLNALIFEDYNKGVLTPSLIRRLIPAAKEAKVVVAVDPKFENIECYQGVDIFKPNKTEAERITGLSFSNDPYGLVHDLQRRLQCENLLITLGAEGMRLFSKTTGEHRVAAVRREVRDVCGAGDTVIAAFTAAVAAGGTPMEAAEIATIAAGIKVGKIGVQPVRAHEIRAELERVFPAPEFKIAAN